MRTVAELTNLIETIKRNCHQARERNDLLQAYVWDEQLQELYDEVREMTGDNDESNQ